VDQGWAIEAGAESRRRLTKRATVILVVVALGAGAVLAREILVSGARARQHPLTVVQVTRTNTFPIQFVKSAGQFLKVAQTFRAPRAGVLLRQVIPFVAWQSGEGQAYVRIYQVRTPGNPESGVPLRTLQLKLSDQSESSFEGLSLDPPLPLDAEKTYAFVIEVKTHGDALGIGQATDRNLYPSGTAWYFASRTASKDEPAEASYSWRTYNDDLTFKLLFVPS
jgi:hypothetical protein